jgi:hypothetical protein
VRVLSNGRLTLSGPGAIHVGRDVNAWARVGRTVLGTFDPRAVIHVGDRVRLNGTVIQAATTPSAPAGWSRTACVSSTWPSA